MDQVDKLILQVQGQTELKQMKEALDAEQKSLAALIDQFKTGLVAQQTFANASRYSAERILDLREQIEKLEKSSGVLRQQGLLQLQYVLDDLVNTSGSWERKLASISNNIPGLVASIGGKNAMGLAGAIGIVSTSLIALAPLAAAAWEALSGGGNGPEPVVKALDAAEEKIKAIRQELERLLKATSPEESESKRLFESVLGGGRGNQIMGALAGAISTSPQGERMNEAERMATSDAAVEQAVQVAAMNASRSGRQFTEADRAEARARALQAQQQARDAAQKRINEANVERAGRIMGAAPTDRAARDTLRAMIRANPGAFAAMPGLLGELDDSEPEAQQAFDRQQAEFEAGNAAAHERRIDRERKARQANQRRRRLEAALARRTREDIATEEEAERLKAQDLRRVERKDAERTRSDIEGADFAEKEKAQAARRQAASDTSALSQNLNLGTPSAEQAEAMARDVLRLQQGGLNHDQAVWMSVYRMLQQIRRNQLQTQQAVAAQMQQFGGPGPDMGQFEFPWGGW